MPRQQPPSPPSDEDGDASLDAEFDSGAASPPAPIHVPRAGTVSQTAWQDRFRAPTPASLEAMLPTAQRETFAAARQALRGTAPTGQGDGGRGGVVEALRWMGVWGWTLCYGRSAEEADCEAYLVPDPSRTLLVVRGDEGRVAEVLEEASGGRVRLGKAARDALTRAVCVDGVRWVEVELTDGEALRQGLAVWNVLGEAGGR